MDKKEVRMDTLKVGDKFKFNDSNYELMAIGLDGLPYAYKAIIVGQSLEESFKHFAGGAMVTPVKQLVRLDSIPDELVRVISKDGKKKKDRIKQLKRENATIERKWRALIADCDKYQELSELPRVPVGHVTIEASALKGMLDESFDAKKRESDIFLLDSQLNQAKKEIVELREPKETNIDANLAMIDLLTKIAAILNMPVGENFNQIPQYIDDLIKKNEHLENAVLLQNNQYNEVCKQLDAANKELVILRDEKEKYTAKLNHIYTTVTESAINEQFKERGDAIEKLTAENKRLTNLLEPSYLADSGWVKIDGAESLPKVDCGLWVIVKWNTTMARLSFFVEIDSNYILDSCTHYRIIKKPLPPQ